MGLFARDGYDSVGVEAIAEAAGVSLRTFYRYFAGKDEVLAPVISDGTANLAERIAARPAGETLAVAVQRAYESVSTDAGPAEVRRLIGLLTTIPALRARWLSDLRTIEETLVPLVRERAQPPVSEDDARLTAAVIVTALRVTLELSASADGPEPSAVMLGRTLQYLRDGARL